jgi:ribosomal protein S18 acetylase RimI-like enzyme
MQSQIVVRRLKYEDGDAEAVRALDALVLGKDRSAAWAEYVDRFLSVSRLRSMTLPSWGSLIAESGTQPVGFLLAERQTLGYGLPTGVRIVAVAVHPEFRRQGVGQMLVDELKNECRRNGIPQIYSVLQSEDERDARFLASCGFQDAPVRVLSFTVA